MMWIWMALGASFFTTIGYVLGAIMATASRADDEMKRRTDTAYDINTIQLPHD